MLTRPRRARIEHGHNHNTTVNVFLKKKSLQLKVIYHKKNIKNLLKNLHIVVFVV